MKNMVKTQNRQRVQEGLLSFKDNGNNTAKIGDIPSNISVEGTRLDENLLNGMQQGLIFTVDSNMTAKAGYDSYELGILGMAGVDNLNGFPMFSGFSLKFKAGATNTQGVVKVKISGTEYDLVKTFGTSVNAIASEEIKQGNIYDITFDGARFSIFQNNINAYGIEAGTVLEGSRLAEALGVKKYGGLITQPGQKYADWAYYEPSMHEIFYCKVNNTDVTPVADKFEPMSNRNLLNRLENLYQKKVELFYIGGGAIPVGATATLPAWTNSENLGSNYVGLRTTKGIYHLVKFVNSGQGVRIFEFFNTLKVSLDVSTNRMTIVSNTDIIAIDIMNALTFAK